SEQIGLGVQLGAISANMGAGAIQTTNNPFDLAIQGDGMFRVAGIVSGTTASPTFGTVNYTRAGNFTTDSSGNLVTQSGMYVPGHAETAQGPPPTFGTTASVLTIPATASSVSIGQDGIVNYIDSTTGTSKALGQITLAKFPNEAGLTAEPGTNYI